MKKLLNNIIISILKTPYISKIIYAFKKEKSHSLHLISQGNHKTYRTKDGEFKAFTSPETIDFSFEKISDLFPSESEDWSVRLCAKKTAGHDVCDDRSARKIVKEGFEVFELKTNDQGDIESFAVNLSQHGKSAAHPPFFSAIRYHSTVPVKASVSDIFGKRLPPTSCFYFKQGEHTEFFTNFTHDFNYMAHSAFGKTIEVSMAIKDEARTCKNRWELELNTNNENGFFSGLVEKYSHEKAEEKWNQVIPKILLHIGSLSYRTFDNGQYRILKIKQDRQGNILELALDFHVESPWNVKSLQAALRFNSDIPIDLNDPFENEENSFIF